MDKPIITGILAYGMSGRVFHAPFITTNPHFQFKAVVERHEKKAAARYPDVISYNHTHELLNDDEIELVIVNTPSYTHYQLAKEALEAGKHVLLEKPAAATSAEVKKLFDISRSTGKKLMVYQNRRYDSGFNSVSEVIESGRLGELIEVHFRYDRYRLAIGPKIFKESSGYVANGLTYDLGPHLLDQAISLFGKPLSYQKTKATHRPGSQVDDYFHFHLQYPNGLNVFLTSSLLAAEPSPAFLVHGVVGSYIKGQHDTQEGQLDKGMLPTDPAYGIEPAGSDGKLVLIGPDNQKEIIAVPSLKGRYNDIFEAVYQTVRHDALFPVTEEHVMWQIEMLEAE